MMRVVWGFAFGALLLALVTAAFVAVLVTVVAVTVWDAKAFEMLTWPELARYVGIMALGGGIWGALAERHDER